jgi:hypothetical protein
VNGSAASSINRPATARAPDVRGELVDRGVTVPNETTRHVPGGAGARQAVFGLNGPVSPERRETNPSWRETVPTVMSESRLRAGQKRPFGGPGWPSADRGDRTGAAEPSQMSRHWPLLQECRSETDLAAQAGLLGTTTIGLALPFYPMLSSGKAIENGRQSPENAAGSLPWWDEH